MNSSCEKSKIKVSLKKKYKKNCCSLTMQIFYMDSRFRNYSEASLDKTTNTSFKSSSGFIISSGNSGPELKNKVVYLWGRDKLQDNILVTRGFSTKENLDEYVEFFTKALQEWSTNWEGWDQQEELVILEF